MSFLDPPAVFYVWLPHFTFGPEDNCLLVSSRGIHLNPLKEQLFMTWWKLFLEMCHLNRCQNLLFPVARILRFWEKDVEVAKLLRQLSSLPSWRVSWRRNAVQSSAQRFFQWGCLPGRQWHSTVITHHCWKISKSFHFC